jgi:hypothetical protein
MTPEDQLTKNNPVMGIQAQSLYTGSIRERAEQAKAYVEDYRTRLTNTLGKLKPNMSIDDARKIIDPVNAEITGDYTRLTTTMRAQLNVGDRQLVDWCGFASWISFSLGAFLRSRVNNKALAMHPWWRRMIIDLFLPRLLDIEQWKGLADGNRAIYVEMRAFYELVGSFEGVDPSTAFDRAGAEADALWDTEVFGFVPETEEDRYWGRHAVRSLILAAATDDQKEKAELIYSASVALSAIEQWRADRQIDDFFEGIISNRRWIPRRLRPRAKRFASRFSTRWMTTFTFDGEFVSVGTPLPEPAASRYSEPGRTLDTLTNPWATTVVDRFWTSDAPHSTDWRDYEERMEFIAALFRSYEEIPSMLDYRDLPAPPNGFSSAPQGPLFATPDPDFVASAKPEPYPEKWLPNKRRYR